MPTHSLMDFFETVYGNKEPSHTILLWTQSDKRSAWFEDYEDAAEYAGSRRHEDIYCGVGLGDGQRGPHVRFKEDEVAALAGFFADVDFADAKAHVKHGAGKTYPPQAEALDIIKEMPFQPSLIVMTGHGYHAWWLFKEPYSFEDQADRQAVKALSRAWVILLQRKAKLRGYDLDSVFDLARMMRIPGTMNCKDPAHKIAVVVVEESTTRLSDPHDVEPFLPADLGGFDLGQPTSLPDDIQYRIVEPPPKYAELLEQDDKFRLSCTRQRPDFKDKGDASASVYDMSVASITARAGWTDQEIIDLLMYLRSKHGEKLKISNEQYYARTVARARRSMAESFAIEALPLTEAGDKDARQRVCHALGMNIQRIIRYKTPDSGLYYIVVDGEMVPIGSMDDFYNQSRFIAKLTDVTGVVRDNMKKPQWLALLQLLRNMAEDEDLGENSDRGQQMTAWIDEYLDRHSPHSEDIERAIAHGDPVIYNDRVWVRLNALQQWLALYVQVKDTNIRLSVALKAIGAVSRGLGTTVRGKFTTRCYWELPEGISERFINESKGEMRDGIPSQGAAGDWEDDLFIQGDQSRN